MKKRFCMLALLLCLFPAVKEVSQPPQPVLRRLISHREGAFQKGAVIPADQPVSQLPSLGGVRRQDVHRRLQKPSHLITGCIS